MDLDKIYAAIDLKSFYASVECVERGLDPLTTNLVVADKSRTEKTICLAVSPSLKKYGIPGRPRLFEVIQKVKRINKERQETAPGHKFIGQSFHSDKLSNPSVALAYITASPRMSLYMKYSTQIYQVYLRYFAPEDIHVYSIDEVFIDLTGYLTNYQMGAKELISKVIQDVLKETGITATAGIGTNLYLAKIAMDIMAKHVPADEYGVRIAYLDEITYRKKLWEHQPITDFWRVGKGYAKKLAAYQIYTMGDVARCSVGKEKEYHNEELLYKLFGINAELLIDHAWGYETCTIADIKVYKPEAKSIGCGQVLSSAYSSEKAKAAGIDAFIAKPLFRSRLTATLRQFTSGRKEKTARNYLEKLSESDYTGKRILLVEDNELNREIAGEILQMTGTKVETAENGKIAVEKVEASPKGSYDLIFMDIQMPVMNGYEATAAIRSLPGAKGKLPIVAMTANAFAEDVQLAKNTGMNGHIAKPLDMNKLNDVLKNWL
ncbi:response regulator [Anaerobutyricum hallii]|uniref:response regulator n=1 Tax=Anaerobutyricum hallii TaxID=39488 RepID=UPI0009E8B672|nr:response regulator [Anaerobutyricum hallii]